ncbi:MAG: hypothetical protein WCI54_01110 [Bacteroidia bacterium]
MSRIKELYQKNIYGLMGTLIFHILLVAGFLVSEISLNVKIDKDEAILLDIAVLQEKNKTQDAEVIPDQKQDLVNASKNLKRNELSSGSNLAVNDAVKKDKFFDASYRKDIEEAQKMVVDVNKQLSKKSPATKKLKMPEATTEGQNPDSIKNTIYSGKSNIHYFLEKRFHIRLPIPVYLAKGGGIIQVDIQVDRTGKVIKAEARTTTNIDDPMLPTYATQAAEQTLFNSDSKAPTIQKGTITYQFVAQ